MNYEAVLEKHRAIPASALQDHWTTAAGATFLIIDSKRSWGSNGVPCEVCELRIQIPLASTFPPPTFTAVHGHLGGGKIHYYYYYCTLLNVVRLELIINDFTCRI